MRFVIFGCQSWAKPAATRTCPPLTVVTLPYPVGPALTDVPLTQSAGAGRTNRKSPQKRVFSRFAAKAQTDMSSKKMSIFK